MSFGVASMAGHGRIGGFRFWQAQIGRTFKKKRPSQPIPCASAWCAAAALLDPHVGDLRRGDDVARLDRARVDLAGKAQHVDVVVDADLLLAGDSRWPFGSTPVTIAVIVPEKSLLFSVVPLPAKLLLDEPAALARLNEFGADARQRRDAGRELAALVDRAGALLARRDLLDDLHGERVADQARAVVLEQRPVLRPAWKIEPLLRRRRRDRPAART